MITYKYLAINESTHLQFTVTYSFVYDVSLTQTANIWNICSFISNGVVLLAASGALHCWIKLFCCIVL